jgi:hypothetical protein
MSSVGSLMCISAVTLMLGCSSSSDGGAFVGHSKAQAPACQFNGKLTGGLNLTVDYNDIKNSCGGASDVAANTLNTGFGGMSLTDDPVITITHDNFTPDVLSKANSASIRISYLHGPAWETAPGACLVNFTANTLDNSTGKVKVAGNGSCTTAAVADSSTSATDNVSIGDFTFSSMEITWN